MMAVGSRENKLLWAHILKDRIPEVSGLILLRQDHECPSVLDSRREPGPANAM